jgi:hypothetical protein
MLEPMSPEDFRDEIEDIIRRHGTDYEAVHGDIDALCWGILRRLGYNDGIALLDGVTLWYA